MSLNGNYDFVVGGLSAAEEMLCFKAADIETWRKRERQQLCTRYPTPLSTYENIIPQRGKIVKRLAAVF